jgi:hypothetical protein
MNKLQPSDLRRIFSRRGRRGQVMIEAIIAATAVLFIIVGVFSLLSQSLHYNTFTSNDYIGTYLASEGIEVVKNILDGNVIRSLPWSCGFTDGNYELSYDWVNPAATPSDCSTPALPSNSNRYLLFDPKTGIYSYNSGSQTIFKRLVTIKSPISNSKVEIQVNSIVSWTSLGIAKSVNLEDRFFEWHTTQ